MTDFKSALGAFLTGEIDLEGLERALADELSSNSESGPDVLLLLEQLYQSGRLPHQIYAVLKRTVLSGARPAAPPPTAQPTPPLPRRPADTSSVQSRSVNTGTGTTSGTPAPGDRAAGPEDDERTRFRLPSNPPKGPPDSGQTRFDVSGQSRRTGQQSSPPAQATGRPPTGPQRTGSWQAGAANTGARQTGAPDTGRPPHTSPSSGQLTGGTGPVSGRYTGTSGGSSWAHPSQWTGGDDDGSRSDVLGIGSIVAKRYVLEEKIGEGGMGTVYKARDLRWEEAQDRNPYVALKLLNEEFKRHPDSLKALQRESRKAQKLAHPNIVNVFNFDRDGGNVFMTMEFLEGQPLDRLIRRHSMRGMQFVDALRIIEGISAGLIHAHKSHIVHSDLKPSNVFITKDGVAKIFDFGIARAVKVKGDSAHEKTMFDAGTLGALTPAYASLEMLIGDDPSLQDDIYALACISYELLTGRHPFDKISADKAMLKKLRPEKVKRLSRSQFNSLRKGLAFERENRSRSVEEFISGLRPVKIQKQVVLGATIAAVLLVTLLSIWVPQFLEGRRVDRLVEAISEGPDERVTESLEEIVSLSGDEIFRDIFADETTQDLFIDYFSRRIAGVFEPSAGRYDFLAADRLLVRLENLPYFSGRGSVEDLREDVEAQRNEAIADSRAELERYRVQGDLIASQGEKNVVGMLEIIRQLDPQDSALSDKGIPIRFAEVADQEVRSGNFTLAKSLVEQGISLIEQEELSVDNETRTILQNLRDLINSEEERLARADRVEQLELTLGDRMPGLTDLTAFDTAQSLMQQLAELEPENASLAQARSKLNVALTNELSALIEASRFDQANDFIDRYGVGLPRSDTERLQQQVATGRQQKRVTIDGLLADLQSAIDAGEIGVSEARSAESRLTALEKAGADDELLNEARQLIAEAYRRRAADARAAQRWDEARMLVQSGLAIKPGSTFESLLRSDLADIESEEQISIADETEEIARLQDEQRQRELNNLRDTFESGLARSAFNVADARALIDTLVSLESKGEQIPDGRLRVMDRLVDRIDQLREEGNLDAAVDLAGQAVLAFPDSAPLRAAAGRIEADVSRGRQEQLAGIQARIEGLLNEPRLDRAWNGEVQDAVRSLEAQLAPGDPMVVQVKERIALAYVKSAATYRSEKRLVNARDQLDAAERFAPGLAATKAEREELQQARRALENELSDSKLAAELERAKQDLRVEAKRENVQGAIGILDDLRDRLPNDDPFVTQEAPKVIADAYVSLGSKAVGRDRFNTARALADKALDWVPQYKPAVDLIRTVDERAVQSSPKQQFDKIAQQIVAALRGGDLTAGVAQFEELRRKFPDLSRDPFIVAEGPQAIAQAYVTSGIGYLDANRAPESKEAVRQALTWVPEYGPAIELRSRIEASAAAPSQAARPSNDPCANPALVGNGANPRARCRDILPNGKKGPILVVIPFDGALAVNAYEVTVGDYNAHCAATGNCPTRGGDGKLPLTGISAKQANEYAAWLASETGFNYRLPTEEEWEFAALAGGGRQPRNLNCEVRKGGQVIKGATLLPVNTGEANEWGLKNYLGNAQEWVPDGSRWSARGGAHSDAFVDCKVERKVSHSGRADSVTGFRLVREINR